ncbi:hypothetical protein DFH09DRAFT_1175990 [Mycena vulgaris]|nr:hypothetical protein DFH09DRAFT_1175990 [Mycena vulgaris]
MSDTTATTIAATMIHAIFAALAHEFGCPGLVSISRFVVGIVLHGEFRKTGLEMLDVAGEAILVVKWLTGTDIESATVDRESASTREHRFPSGSAE